MTSNFSMVGNGVSAVIDSPKQQDKKVLILVYV
jgi:hypothetical protein